MQGMSTPEWSGYLADVVGVPGTAAELAEAVIDEIEHRYATELPLIPGAIEAVERIAAAFRLGLDPNEAAAVEDSSNGLRSAHAAGLAVVALPHAAFPPAAEALALARTTVHALADVTVELINSLGSSS
jgi:beta-phosphoglucomutase-like phosphatase (HAD superfamily)